jgi:hypothetical protein
MEEVVICLQPLTMSGGNWTDLSAQGEAGVIG